MFQLNAEEWEILKSQIVISSWGGTRKLPFAFTEQGLAMLSGVLNSDIAIEVNISIMRAFVAVRQLVSALPVNDITRLQNEIKELKEYVEEAFADYNDINEDTRMQLELINQAIAELQVNDKRPDGNPVIRSVLYLIIKENEITYIIYRIDPCADGDEEYQKLSVALSKSRLLVSG